MLLYMCPHTAYCICVLLQVGRFVLDAALFEALQADAALLRRKQKRRSPTNLKKKSRTKKKGESRNAGLQLISAALSAWDLRRPYIGTDTDTDCFAGTLTWAMWTTGCRRTNSQCACRTARAASWRHRWRQVLKLLALLVQRCKY
jgi:hypothetical protein